MSSVVPTALVLAVGDEPATDVAGCYQSPLRGWTAWAIVDSPLRGWVVCSFSATGSIAWLSPVGAARLERSRYWRAPVMDAGDGLL